LKLLTDIMYSKYDYVLICTTDRLVRWGREIIELICSVHNTKIIFTEEDPDKTDEQELADDLLNIIHIFSCRKYGSRSAQRLKVNPNPETLSLILHWAYVENYSTYRIVQELDKQGKQYDDQNRLISRRIVRRVVKDNLPFKAAILGKVDDEIGNSLDLTSPAYLSLNEFSSAQLRMTIGGNRSLMLSKLKRAYRSYCGLKGLEEASTRQILKYLGKRWPECEVVRNAANGTHYVKGLALHNLKS
jgi:hypothetical protein